MGRKNTFPNPRMEPGAPVVTRTNLFTNPRSAATIERITRTNLLLNPSFESGLVGWEIGASTPVATLPTGTAMLLSRLATTGTASTVAPPTTGYPDATNTGWARTGVTLAAYTGPLTLAANETLDSVQIDGNLTITSNVTITRSQINGYIDCNGANYSITLQDCNINAGTYDGPAVGFNGISLLRCEVIGGTISVNGSFSTSIQDSWLHSQYLSSTSTAAENAFISNGGSNITITHCTLHADQAVNSSGGGASTNCSLVGEFAQVANVSITNCLIKATPGKYGVNLGYDTTQTYGSNPTNVQFSNNVFEWGTNGNNAAYGPVTGYLNANGNQFYGNTWYDGPSQGQTINSDGTTASTYPDATNTGYRGTLTTVSSVTPTAGETISNKQITGNIVLSVDNVTFSNCLFTGASYFTIDASATTGTTIEDCTFTAPSSNCSVLFGTNTTMLRCDISASSDGLKAGDGCVIQDCYIHDLMAPTADSHNDGIQFSGAQNTTVRHCAIHMGPGATSCILMGGGEARPASHNQLFEDCLFDGGGYSFYGPADTSNVAGTPSTDIICRNNKFTTAAGYGPVTSWVDGPGCLFYGNTWNDGANAGKVIFRDGTTASSFPVSATTGVPSGVTLTPLTISSGYTGTQTVKLDRVEITGDIRLYDNVEMIITNSIIHGHTDVDAVGVSLTLMNCKVDASTYGNAATGFQNLTFVNCELTGGITSINSSINGYFENCYLWDQYVAPTGQTHTGGFLCSGGHDIELRHCTIWNSSQDNGDGGGPSASVNIYENFAQAARITFDNCYVMATAGGYEASFGYNTGSAYPPPTSIVVRDCVFQHGPNGTSGGVYGTVTSWYPNDPTNQWINNTWDDGTPIPYDI